MKYMDFEKNVGILPSMLVYLSTGNSQQHQDSRLVHECPCSWKKLIY